MSVIKSELRFQALSFPSKPLGLQQHLIMGLFMETAVVSLRIIGEMAQWVECLLCTHVDLSMNL